MQFEVSKFNKRSFSAVTITHGDEPELVFNTVGYRSTRSAASIVADDENKVDLFTEVNDFINKLTKVEQNTLYEIYARVESMFQDLMLQPGDKDSGLLEKLLRKEVENIYEIVKFEDLRDYVVCNSRLKLPPELFDDYRTTDKITPLYKEKTYLLREYTDLLAMTLGLRFMIPIWGPYLPIVQEEVGKHMKEYEAYRLLSTSRLFKCPAFDRLEVYIRANLENEEEKIAPRFAFLSTEEIPTYLIAISAVRKLSIAPLSVEEQRQHHLMRIVFNYAMNRHDQLPQQLGMSIIKKSSGETGVDDNSSVWCMHKMKENISRGDLEIIQTYLSDYQANAKYIVPEIQPERVELCVKQCLSLQIHPRVSQKYLAAWTLSPVVVGSVVEIYDHHNLMVLMGTAQAVLWAWGFEELAILLTATPIELEEDEFRTSEGRYKISQNALAELDAIYPYKLRESRFIPGGSSTNAGVRGIDLMVSDFNQEWKPNCNLELAKSFERCDVTRRINPSPNIRNQIADLLIRLDGHIR